MTNIIKKIKKAPLLLKALLILIFIASFWLLKTKVFSKASAPPQHQTALVQRGTLISSINASGTISGGNNTTIYTSASGLVTKVYVKNGDKVTQGQKLADIKLDQDAVAKQSSAWASYLNAKNNYENALINKASLVASVDSSNKAVMDAQNAVNTMNENISNGIGNPSTRKSYTDLEKNSITSTLTIARQNYNIANQKLAQADQSIAAALAQKTSAWHAYQQTSPTITAPASGIISNFALTPGISLANLSSTSSSSGSGSSNTQSVGVITNPDNLITANVDLTEIDVVKAQPGQKVTLTMDAFPGKTFTGKILAINTNGKSSSGVTTYPATIVFDSGLPTMYPNMAVTAQIITGVRDDVLMVPNAAVKTSAGQSTVQVLKDNQPSTVVVEIGTGNDTHTEIVSGLNPGDTVITNTILPSSGASSGSQMGRSPFSTFGGVGAGGNAVRIMR